MDQERIFLSAVSGEFRAAREKLASTLTGLALLVREQSDFSADPRGLTLLDKMHDSIRDCGCVVSLIGKSSGPCHPTPAEAEPYLSLLPPGIGNTWSHTQWEVFFALHYRKNIITIQAADTWQPDTEIQLDDQQTRFIAYLKSRGTDLTIQVTHPSDVRAKVMRALWPAAQVHAVTTIELRELLALARTGGAFQRATEQGIPEPAVRAIVQRLGGEGIAHDDLLPWIDNWIEAARQELARRPNEGEAFEAARQEAERRFRAGRLTDASNTFMDEFAREEPPRARSPSQDAALFSW